MKRSLTPARGMSRQRGLTLIELMVAMTVGLIVSLAITGSVLLMGRQFKVVGANAAAQGSAQIALAMIDLAGRTAGAGMFSNGQLLCPTLNAWKDGVVKSNGAVFMPARITDGGGAAASDTLVFSASNSTGALSAMPVIDRMASPNAAVVVSDAGNLDDGDLAIVGAPGSGQPCTLFQLTDPPSSGVACAGNATSCKTLERAGGGAGFNPPDAAAVFTTPMVYGFEPDTGVVPPVHGPAAVTRLGGDFRQDAFSVNCESLIQFNAFNDAPTCTSNPLSFAGGANALATDIVLMQAQYGLSAISTSDVVTQWVDATGAWANPAAADVGRVKALRVVIVARSKEPDAGMVTDASCTNDGGVVNTGPCSFRDASAPVIDLSAVPVPAGRNWRNYRYRVHQAVVPLRNVIWSAS